MASIYTALDISNYEIRIITIHPGDDDTIISCTLHKQSLLAEQEYTALSYCWGDPTITDQIIVNGEQVAVTINLQEALQQLRSIGVERVWADALCINQKDIQERSLQVRNMTQVYACAAQTYAWLGKEGSDRAAASLIFLRQIISTRIELGSIEHTHLSEVDTGIELGVAFACPSCVAEEYLRGLEDLFRRDYWRRRWVIQEIVAARRVQVVCGRESIDLGSLYSALELCKKSKHWSPGLISCCKYLQQIIDICRAYQSRRPQTLSESMISTQHFLSSDSRDRVFALIGITSDGGRLVPTPNYYQDYETMLTNLVAAVFREQRNFNMMLVDRCNRAANPRLPTWVPDLPLEDPKHLSHILHDDLLDTWHLERSLSGPPGTLRVQGFIVGVIVATSSVLMNVPLEISTMEASSNDTISIATPQTQPQEYYGSSSGMLKVIIRLLTLPIETTDMSVWRYAHSQNPQTLWGVHDRLHRLRMVLRHTSRPSLASLQEWIDTNKAFFLGKKSLSEWLTEGKISYYYYWLKSILLRLWFVFAPLSFVPVMASSIKVVNLGVKLSAPGLIAVVPCIFMAYLWLILSASRFVCASDFTYFKLAKELESNAMNRKRMILCNEGMIGMSTADAQCGDRVCLLKGCSTAVVLRKNITQPRNSYAVIGRASMALDSQAGFRDNQREFALV